MRGWSRVLLLAGVCAPVPRATRAATLADVFRKPEFAQVGLAPLGTALAATVAAAYPVASASSSVVYEYDPAEDTLVRRAAVAGPLFGERAETIGRRTLNLGVSWSYIHFTTINGDDLDSLQSRRRVGGRILFVRVPGGVTLRNGRFTNVLPVEVTADVDVTVQQVAASVTYGLTPHLDVNVTAPILHTSLDLLARGRAPDPRFPAFGLPGGRTLVVTPAGSADATGVGDILVRGKYRFDRAAPADVAVGLAVALPSGNDDDFQGAGATRVQPTLIVSRVLAARFGPFLDAGVECNADDVARSVVRWAVGGTADVVRGVTAAVTFLGRNELGAQAEPIRFPFFAQIERADAYDASVGLRWRFAEQGLLSADVVLPLDRDGIRADAIPVVEAEYVF